jgi:ankyrin repeat protein
VEAKELFDDPRVVALAEAGARGDAARVQSLVAEGTPVNAIGRLGATPLIWTMLARNKEGMRALLAAGADPNLMPGDEQETAVILAAGADDVEFLRILLDAGGDPNARNPRHKDEPALVKAAFTMQWDNMRLLLDRGADINAQARDGTTALLQTALLHQYPIVVELLERGADHLLPMKVGATLAWMVHTAHLPAHSDLVPSLRKSQEILRSRGVTFPPPSPAEIREMLRKKSGKP